MGLRVLLLDTKPSNPNHYICLAIFHTLQKHPGVEAVYLASFGDAIALAQRHQCNLFFAFDGEGLHIDLCQRLKAICGYALVWNTEDPYELPVNLAHATLFDHIYTNDSASVSAYGGKATHLPLAASEQFQYHPVLENSDCRYDLFFAGTAWPNRVQLIGQLANLMDGSLRMKLAMPTNEHLPAIENLPLAPSVYNWRTSNIEFARFANQSRITLGLHRDFSTTPGAPTAAMTPGPRIFEVAMAGGFQLVDQALAETGQFFALGKELITFDGEKDCLDKVDYFLRHPDERVAIAKAAQAKALEAHTYSARIDAILASLPAQVILSGVKNTGTDAKAPSLGGTSNTSNAIKSAGSGKRRVLYVTHNLVGDNMWGGVELYQDAMRQRLGDDVEIYFYCPMSTPEEEYKKYGLFNERLEQVDEFVVNAPWNLRLLSCNERERIFSQLLIKHHIDLVHFQHLMLHVPSLPFIASALGIPTMYTWHDYYGICMKFNLVGMYGNYCGVETMPLSGCDACLYEFATPGSQVIRREFYARMFEKINVIHVSTQEVLDRVKAVYPTIADTQFAIQGIPLAHPPAKGVLEEHAKAIKNNERMQAVIFGNFTVTKGSKQLLHMMEGLRDCPVDIHIHGRIDDDVFGLVENLNVPNAFFHEPYHPKEISQILANKDIAIFSAIWPETYSLALSEVVLSGVVPVAPNLGAFSVRITDRINGFLYPDRNIGQLISVVQELVYAPSLVAQARAQLSLVPTEQISEHSQWLKQVYGQMLSLVSSMPALATIAPATKAPATKALEANQSFNLKDCGILLNHLVWTTPTQEVKVARIATLSVAQPLPKRVWHYYKANGLLGVAKRLARVRVRVS